jgi:hypothetical protein
VVPGDALATELRTRLALEPCLLAGWLELARVERSHLASCSVPQVTNVYAEAMKAVNSRRKKEPMIYIETIILGKVTLLFDKTVCFCHYWNLIL